MADDSLNILIPMNFHCCNIPKGMKRYIPEDLSTNEQQCLDELKIETLRDNQQYLSDHPEVRAIVALIFRLLMKQRPTNPESKINFYEIIAQRFFVDKSVIDLREEIDAYLGERRLVWAKKSDHVCHVSKYYKSPKAEESVSLDEQSEPWYEDSSTDVCREILCEMLDSLDVYEKSDLQINESIGSNDSDFDIAPEVTAGWSGSLTSVLEELKMRTAEDEGSDIDIGQSD